LFYSFFFSDIDDVFKGLKGQCKEAGVSTYLLSLLQNLLIMPLQEEAG